jgi:hypothetical protein
MAGGVCLSHRDSSGLFLQLSIVSSQRRYMTRTLILAALVLLPQSGAGGGFADRLVGVWTGTGTVLKQPASVQLEWVWALDRQFLKLTFGNDMGPAGQQHRFEGHAYYRAVGEGRYRGTWFDSSGAIRPIDARIDGDALVSRWGTAETEEGETTYRLLGQDSMEIVDRVKRKDGTWRDFGKTTLTRRAR